MNATPFFRRMRNGRVFDELLTAVSAGDRVRVLNPEGNVMLNCSLWLFDQCWARGWFEDVYV